MIVNAICAYCGREFEYDTAGHRGGMRKCCSKECAVKRIRQQKRIAMAKYRKRMTGNVHVRTVSNGGLQSAEVKPDHTSDARWRCELRRREKPDYYTYCGMEVR